jgi:hypothetical protein
MMSMDVLAGTLWLMAACPLTWILVALAFAIGIVEFAGKSHKARPARRMSKDL